MARPEGFDPPTPKFVAWCSIQLSYGRVWNRSGILPEYRLIRQSQIPLTGPSRTQPFWSPCSFMRSVLGAVLELAESEGFEPSIEL